MEVVKLNGMVHERFEQVIRGINNFKVKASP